MDIQTLRQEYGTLHTEAGAIIENAKNEKRDLTAQENKSQKARYARMDEIEKEKQDRIKAAEYALESGTAIFGREPDGKEEYALEIGRHSNIFTKPTDPVLYNRRKDSAVQNINMKPSIGIGEYCRSMVLGLKQAYPPAPCVVH